MKYLLIVVFILLNFSLQAETKKKIEISEFDQIREQEMEMIRKLIGADHFKQMDERLEMLMKKFMNSNDNDDIEKFFDRSHFDKFMQDWNPHQGLDEGETHWMETPTERILILKLKQTKDSPIDIKIQNNIINVSGKNIIKSGQGTSISSFSKSESVPTDVDANSAEIENKNGDIQVRFKKLTAAKKMPGPKKKATPDLLPLKKGLDDEVI
jgi:HSP20 family molecular chaperone IbpA